MSPSSTPLKLRDFALRKQAPLDGLVNLTLNLVITYLIISGAGSIPVVAPPGSEFSRSVLGSLVVPAVVIAFAISLLTTRITINKRIKGEVSPPLEPGKRWLNWALGWGLFRALNNLLVVYGVAGIIEQFYPGAQVSPFVAALIVGAVAGIIAYVQSAFTISRTRDLE